ncbi:MAG: NAD-dependent deacylase [Albidovulum sp.]|nr:NAD-dependent deacylase [Albidovulum sp.]
MQCVRLEDLDLFKRIVILTGAGISAESGLSTFRDKDGLWAKYDLAAVATPEGFRRNPGQVIDFYNMRRAIVTKARPNAAHIALAGLEERFQGEVALVTQNTDDLHEKAGSRNVLHIHGEISKAKCAECEEIWPAPIEMNLSDACPKCFRRATRPNVVWFGEIPYYLDEVAELLRRADVLVSIGTSGQVYPAAGFAAEAAGSGAETLELNLEPSAISNVFDRCVYGPATRIVPEWVDELLSA